MAPILVSKTYKRNVQRKKKRPYNNFQNVFKIINSTVTEDSEKSLPVFDALYVENIKKFKSKLNKVEIANKENFVETYSKKKNNVEENNCSKRLCISEKNSASTIQDFTISSPSVGESTFDKIRKLPELQPPKIHHSSKTSEYSSSSINTSEKRYELRSSASETSCDLSMFSSLSNAIFRKPASIDHNTSLERKRSLRRLSCRRRSHVVIPSHVQEELQQCSPSFRDVYHVPTNIYTTKCRRNIIASPIEEDEEEEVSLTEESFVHEPEFFTARSAVLQRCNQKNPVPFSVAYPPSYWSTCTKIGEGVYGEVFMSEGEDKSVLKIIPIEGDCLVNGEPQKKFEEILSEIVIAMELSNLRSGKENSTHSFSEMKRCSCVQGEYPKQLINLWDEYNENKGSENDSPSMFREDQLYIILELANGGRDLEAYHFNNAAQSHSIFVQTAFALAVAEMALEFEHRDLHWGNVLISETVQKTVVFRICGQEFSVPTKGVQVTIIDFTLSRMSYDGCCIYNDLSKDPTLFTAVGDYQFEIYRLMRDSVQDKWDIFKPFTNILWLHYLLEKMCTLVNYRRKSTRLHKQGIEELKKLYKVVLDHQSATDFVLSNLVE
ncbi:serine/threonine-protein kinase haspin homolog isoform X4 [Periplaneta americana]|uniref:serine/threonine-protein kinase haspin homolog isoform X4 n=1 Tax=Periplaneta americana TaxID=6978 RepID=UPI0037E850D4